MPSALGGFVSGFQQGSDYVDSKRRTALQDQYLQQATANEKEKRMGLYEQRVSNAERAGKPIPEMPEEVGLVDPVENKIQSWFKGLGAKGMEKVKGMFGGGGGEAASAGASAMGDSGLSASVGADTSTSVQPSTGGITPTAQRILDENDEKLAMSGAIRGRGYKDGGAIRRFADGGMSAEARAYQEELARREASKPETTVDRSAEKPQSRTQQAKAKVKDAAGKAGQKASSAVSGSPEARASMGKGRSALNSKAGALYVAGAGIDAAITGYNTDTEDYYERFGFTPESQRTGDERTTSVSEGAGITDFLKEVFTGGQAGREMLARALGVSSDLANSLSFGQAEKMFRDKQQGAAVATPAAPAAPAPAEERKIDPSVGPTRTARPKEPTEAPVEEAAPKVDPIQWIDAVNSGATADDIPHQSVKDWEDYRYEQVDAMLRQGIDSQTANDRVTAVQHRGFIQYGTHAMQLLANGQLEAAAMALRTAYQYFPNGADVSFGIQNNQLVSMGRDENTGEPIGSPMIITADRLSAQLENFSKPGAFSVWTKDKEAGLRADREAQSQDEYRKGMLGVAQQNAYSTRMSAGADVARASGRGGQDVKITDRNKATEMFTVEAREFLYDTFPELPPDELNRRTDAMRTIMLEIWQTGANDYMVGTIAAEVKDALRQPQPGPALAQIRQRYGLNRQQ